MDRQLNRHLVGDLRSWEPSILFGADSTVNGGSWDVIRFAPYLHLAIVARCERQATLRGTSLCDTGLQVWLRPATSDFTGFGKDKWCQLIILRMCIFRSLIISLFSKVIISLLGENLERRRSTNEKQMSITQENV